VDHKEFFHERLAQFCEQSDGLGTRPDDSCSESSGGIDPGRNVEIGRHWPMSAQLLPVPLESQSHSQRRLPRHIGFIPDGNRRWAVQHGLAKEQRYASGIAPGLALFEACKALGVEEVSVYGFTQDNTRRPTAQGAVRRPWATRSEGSNVLG
jgi:hypothetical protein